MPQQNAIFYMTTFNIKDKIIEVTFNDSRLKFVNYMYV